MTSVNTILYTVNTMLTLPLRSFQLKPTDYLDKLPVLLTRYGVPLATVQPYRLGEEEEDKPKLGEKKKSVNTVVGWCQGHFEKGRDYELTKVTYLDENGSEVVKGKWLCPRCIQSLLQKGSGTLQYD